MLYPHNFRALANWADEFMLFSNVKDSYIIAFLFISNLLMYYMHQDYSYYDFHKIGHSRHEY